MNDDNQKHGYGKWVKDGSVDEIVFGDWAFDKLYKGTNNQKLGKELKITSSQANSGKVELSSKHTNRIECDINITMLEKLAAEAL